MREPLLLDVGLHRHRERLHGNFTPVTAAETLSTRKAVMLTRIRSLAGVITLAGAALLTTPDPAYSTMKLPIVDPILGTRFCCGSDSDGDGKPEMYCCFNGGCTVGPTGCRRI